MTFVAINVLTVPEGAGGTLESRFAARQGAVDGQPGFLSFELLRPVQGTADYLVLTRWESREQYEAWLSSQAFRGGHAGGSGSASGDQQRPVAMGSQVWTFEVALGSR